MNISFPLLFQNKNNPFLLGAAWLLTAAVIRDIVNKKFDLFLASTVVGAWWALPLPAWSWVIFPLGFLMSKLMRSEERKCCRIINPCLREFPLKEIKAEEQIELKNVACTGWTQSRETVKAENCFLDNVKGVDQVELIDTRCNRVFLAVSPGKTARLSLKGKSYVGSLHIVPATDIDRGLQVMVLGRQSQIGKVSFASCSGTIVF
jgi:hypothetical protein